MGCSGYASLGDLVVWASKPPAKWFIRFGPQSPAGVPVGMGGRMWPHHKACVEMKQSREETAIIWLDLKLDHFAYGLSGSAKISKDILEMCNSSTNKIVTAPNLPSLWF